jgi:acetoacetate decarboxylase
MTVRGTITQKLPGFSMPVDAPMFPAPPYHYYDASMLIFNYVTDAASAARLLPAALELADPPTAALVFASYPRSSLGPYNEVILLLNASFQGRAVKYATHLYVTTDIAMAAGREMGGFPKKIGRIEFRSDVAYVASLERPEGLRICSGTLRPEKPVPAQFPISNHYFTLRVIPSPQKDKPPTLAELVETRWDTLSGEMWSGPGSCLLTGASALDPLHTVPVRQLQSCLFLKGNLEVGALDQVCQYPLG